ncbi:uncharacterized protein LACBIDRAFT_331781 [Laccaria bicolor S238N-H82]|uniref:Predicted protein n=1 Tax=Laccaria bicolor (strain S238N-H82 / ATCC MYA-4686) TaxID=486041 RepID=B0DQJ1_LACBS|nr:uncharacterized protein LACBIDRAFT_331781 [Laccaria bicolor S238N-H82]EDR03043.1 predicted protein [Laccaria bicolor S238N-H82]|eukprot:XP_001886184.1 predicted protein [Laccaria bicolor S238N-H82]
MCSNDTIELVVERSITTSNIHQILRIRVRVVAIPSAREMGREERELRSAPPGFEQEALRMRLLLMLGEEYLCSSYFVVVMVGRPAKERRLRRRMEVGGSDCMLGANDDTPSFVSLGTHSRWWYPRLLVLCVAYICKGVESVDEGVRGCPAWPESHGYGPALGGSGLTILKPELFARLQAGSGPAQAQATAHGLKSKNMYKQLLTLEPFTNLSSIIVVLMLMSMKLQVFLYHVLKPPPWS